MFPIHYAQAKDQDQENHLCGIEYERRPVNNVKRYLAAGHL